MTTVNLGNYSTNQPEANLKTENVLITRISLSVSGSSGRIFNINKIPHGAIPTDAIFIPGSALPANGAIIKFGTSASPDLFFTSQSFSVAGGPVRCKNPLGTAQQISLSDDKMPRYDAIQMLNTGTILSVGFMGDLLVYYKMPGQPL
jgi:hypothetical protein